MFSFFQINIKFMNSSLKIKETQVPLKIAKNSSLGEAHAEVTNALFLHLGKPPFLMCPVEYSGNRANPSVTKSEYLATLGSKLHPDIGIFWTGGKVVSETICKEELIVVRKVLRRKPVIWDNLGRISVETTCII